MGGWVLRRDGEICLDKLQKAAHEVTMRHDALRASPADPLRMLSFILDTAVMFTLVARLLDTRGPWSCRLRRYISWALKQTWPKIQVDRPEEVYGPGDFPSPLVVIPVPDQQNAEWHCKHRRGLLQESGRPVDIALIQLRVKLEGLWVYGVNGGMGDFAILPSPQQLQRRCRILRPGLGGPQPPRGGATLGTGVAGLDSTSLRLPGVAVGKD